MKAIEALFETYKNSVYQKDVEAFTALFDEQVLVFDMWQLWTYEGLPAWRAMVNDWLTMLGTNRDVVIFSNIKIQASGDLATATAFVRFTAVSEKGKELRFLENRLTWIVQQKEGIWKIIHQHTSSPINFETMQAILQR
jgi:uncharacterized protein (TIGR02246 family)